MTTEESLVSFGLKQASFKSLKKKQLNVDIPSITITYVKKRRNRLSAQNKALFVETKSTSRGTRNYFRCLTIYLKETIQIVRDRFFTWKDSIKQDFLPTEDL